LIQSDRIDRTLDLAAEDILVEPNYLLQLVRPQNQMIEVFGCNRFRHDTYAVVALLSIQDGIGDFL